MNSRMQASLLADGRLHLNDGPIDLIVLADGSESARRAALEAAVARFSSVLDELCAELPYLRTAASRFRPRPNGVIARRMDAAARSLSDARFITPMAAVAGAVADEILAAMLDAVELRRAYVNNGGDIALHVRDGASLRVGVVDRPDEPSLFGVAALEERHGVGGVATSGWRGRSFSLGIADTATVLATNAAAADAAATLIANAVDLPDHPNIVRAPARECDPQSDLGDRLVTRAVGDLAESDIAAALTRGEEEARRLIASGSIIAASLRLRGATRVVGVLGAPARKDVIRERENSKWRLSSASS
ncbi:MAG TPA: UPF0280 family protein [Rhodoblastus sp.]|nr:UPF0280 family protein [Rhodoblastus sp.]